MGLILKLLEIGLSITFGCCSYSGVLVRAFAAANCLLSLNFLSLSIKCFFSLLDKSFKVTFFGTSLTDTISQPASLMPLDSKILLILSLSSTNALLGFGVGSASGSEELKVSIEILEVVVVTDVGVSYFELVFSSGSSVVREVELVTVAEPPPVEDSESSMPFPLENLMTDSSNLRGCTALFSLRFTPKTDTTSGRDSTASRSQYHLFWRWLFLGFLVLFALLT